MPATKTPQPWDYNVIAQMMRDYAPPSGAFDPNQHWVHRYNIYFMNIRKKTEKKGTLPSPNATLMLESTPRGNEVELLAEYSSMMDGDLTRVKMRCQNNVLLSPIAWDLTFKNKRATGQGLVEMAKKGEVKDGQLLINGKPARNSGVKLDNYASDWGLFAAAQRFPLLAPTLPMQFSLLEYLEIPRANQTLHASGEGKIQRADGDTAFHHYLHYGEAMQPTHYCLDANNRLFMAINPRRFSVLMDEKV